MADQPANAGAGGGLAGDLALPPAVHHSASPRPVPGYRPAPAPAPAPAQRPEPSADPRPRPEPGGHRRRGTSGTSGARARTAARPGAAERPLRPSWLPYLVVLAGVVAGLVIASYSSRDALTGVAVIAGALLAAALARLVLPPQYAGPLCARSRTYDVLALTVLGGSVLAIVLTLP